MTKRVILPCGWDFTFSEEKEFLSEWVVAEVFDFINNKWRYAFETGEGTWIERHLQEPSLVVRFEFIIRNGKVHVCEVDDRPRAIGYCATYDPFFRANLERLRAHWPPLAYIQSDKRPGDDELWLEKPLSFAEARKTDACLLVLSRPEEEEFHEFIPKAVAPVKNEGNKSYLQTLGLAHEVYYRFAEKPCTQTGELKTSKWIEPELPDPCVVKPIQGTRARRVVFYANKKNQPPIMKKGDFIGKGQVASTIRNAGGVMLCQDFVAPMQLRSAPELNAIYRFFFGYNVLTGQYEPIGGMWNATLSVKVHGELGAITGPLRF